MKKIVFLLLAFACIGQAQNRIYSLTEETNPDSTSYLLIDRSSYALPKKVKVANLLNIEAQKRTDLADSLFTSTGLENGRYIPNENTNYLKQADFTAAGVAPSLFAADSILDATIDTLAGMWIWGYGDESVIMNVKDTNYAAGDLSICIGGNNQSIGAQSAAIGRNNVSIGLNSVAIGYYAASAYKYSFAHGGGAAPDSLGTCQTIQTHGYTLTTDATPANVYIGNNSANKWLIPTDAIVNFEINIVAVQTAGAAGTAGDSFTQTIRGGIKNLAGTTALIGAVNAETAIKDVAFAGTVAVTADNVNDCLQVEVTGEASKSIKWVVEVKAVMTGFRNFTLGY